ncbi:MAG TPA: hypothetical protein VGJ60_06130 [Chloroflexota bacterium]
MRAIFILIAASVVLGTSAGPMLGANTQRAEELVVGILQDVVAILSSFAGGPDDPQGPVTNSATLARDSARLDAATQKANELASEMRSLQDRTSQRARP